MVRKNPNNLMIWRTIKGSIGRYLAILAIIALGSGVFAGLCVSSDAMVRTADAYYREFHFSDFTTMSTLGFEDEDVSAAAAVSGVLDAEGAVSADVLALDPNENLYALKVHSITERINQVNLIAGRMPEADHECLLDATTMDRALLGSELRISSDTPAETLDMLKHETYNVVGLITSPYYLNNERGSTTIGTGVLAGFVYLPQEAFDVDYFTEIYVSLGDVTPEIYSDVYDALVDSVEPELEDALTLRAEERYADIISEAEAEISDGEKELSEGREELEREKQDALTKLDEAKTELDQARVTLDDGWIEYENGVAELQTQTSNAEAELAEAELTLAEALEDLREGEASYGDGKEALEEAEIAYQDGLLKYEEGFAEYESGKTELEAARAQLEAGEAAYADGMSQLTEGEKGLAAAYEELLAAKDQIAQAKAQLDPISAFYEKADGYCNAINGLGYSFATTGQFVDSLSNAAEIVGNEQAIRYQTVYGISEGVLQAASLTPEFLLASAQYLTAAQQAMILNAVNYAGQSYGISYPDFASYCSELATAAEFMTSDSYMASSKLVSDASAVVGAHVSDYDGSTGLQGFLTDWNYYAAVVHAMAANLNCAPDQESVKAAIISAETEYEDGFAQYEAGLAELERNRSLLQASRISLDAGWTEWKAGEKELAEAEKTLLLAKEELDSGLNALNDGKDELNSGREELDNGWAAYNDGIRELADGRNQLQTETQKAEETLRDAKADLLEGEDAYADGLIEYQDGLQEFEEEIADAEATIAENEILLQDAREELSKIEPPSLYLLNRDTNIGYACFKNDALIIDGIARVFPIFFFLVAALVCITTMTRMVEDDRTQIGVMKALGYGKWQISKKYLLYSGSASLFGCILGLILGMWAIPFVLWQAYSMIYEFSDILFYFNVPLAVSCTVGYLACALGVTWLACKAELQDAPANLIRPKAPKAGKRIFLERIPFLWRHLTFLYKVSLRNVFRYKKRLFMMLLGIGGCTGLLLTGFGVQDSIQDFANYQFDDISLYDGLVTFDEHMDAELQQEFLAVCDNSIADAVFLHVSNVDLNGRDHVSTASLIATNDSLDGFMDFHEDKRPVAYPGAGECIISRGLSDRFGYAVGDELSLRDADLNETALRIADIYDNYVDYFIYTVPESLGNWSGGDEINSAYVNYPDDADTYECTAEVAANDIVVHVQDTTTQRDRVNTMMSSLNYIVAMIVILAGALAFIVLYNLTNINISERIREIATLKVLGFYAKETATYVFRENIILTVMGAFVGLGLGKMLHAYVMNQVKVDGVLFDVRVLLSSYIMAFALTIVFACLVNGVMYFKIKKINMAESLKSVE